MLSFFSWVHLDLLIAGLEGPAPWMNKGVAIQLNQLVFLLEGLVHLELKDKESYYIAV